MKHKLLLIGAGGHCKVVLDMLLEFKEYEITGIIDRKERVGDDLFGVRVIGTDSDLSKLRKKGIGHSFVSVGSIGDASLRAKLHNLAAKAGFIFPNLIHPSALVSLRADLGTGNYVAPGVIINAGARIGDGCILNTGVIIEHDCVVEDFAHISPGAILNGGVTVGGGSHIGAGSVVIQNLNIGANTIIGAGSVVTKNVRRDMVAYGNPCKERKKNV